ncbi:hypothetical protein F5I97DRAFT_1831413 [Phlebopus sp. FC_14]|nr:hypothetical protein F5I97DRAFT_1831413 [Phlebopus sp. FC_14]
MPSISDNGRLKAVRLDVNVNRPTLKSAVDDIVKTYPAWCPAPVRFHKPETVDVDLLTTELNTIYTSIEPRPTFLYPVTSGLAVVPLPTVPNYCATKSALHSVSLTLNVQLKEKNVHVVEIMPPVPAEHEIESSKTKELGMYWESFGRL